MPIAGGILVAGTAAHCLSSAAGMLRFLARLSGRRRHVRRSSCSGGEDTGEEEAASLGLPSPLTEGEACCVECNVTTTTTTTTTATTTTTTGSSAYEHRQRLRRPHHRHNHCHCHRHRCYHSRRTSPVCTEEIARSESVLEKDENDEENEEERRCRHPEDISGCQEYPFHFRGGLRPLEERLKEDSPPSPHQFRRRHDDPDDFFRTSSSTANSRGCWFIPPYLATLLILSYTLFGIADACSSRSTPKPRPPAPTPRPNITFHMYTCPPDYAEWYCLNGATCFTVKIVDSVLYNCLCANGYIGQRCEFKDLDGSYLPSRQRVMLETASIAGGATIAVFLVVIICIAAYIHCKRKQKELRTSGNCVDTVDGPGRDPELRPFSNRSRSLMIFMAKNPNGSTAIEQTRMPSWNNPETESMRLASISEGRRSNQ